MRDFRDAKTMAHTLRTALQVKAVETTHSECLELIAKAFGFENWNILAAKIETAQLHASGAPPLAPAEEQDPAPQKPTTLYCSFCGKSQHEVAPSLPDQRSSSAMNASGCATTSSRTRKS